MPTTMLDTPSSPAAVSPVRQVVADVPAAEWDAFVSTHPDGGGYHLSGWRGVFTRAFRHETRYLGVRRDGALTGVLPLVFFRSPLFGRFAVSLPFVNYGGLLAEDPGDREALVAEATAQARAHGCAHVELRHIGRLLPAHPARTHKVTMWLSLPATAEALWEGFDRKVRNQVRKAEKSGLVAESGGAELLDAFYPVFAQNMRDLGTPVYPKAFFAEVLAAFPDATRVFLVRKDGQPIAGSITYTFGGAMQVPWASSLREFLALSPNNALYWEMLRHAVGAGCRRFDFGRSTPEEGTYQFKKQWGAEPEPLHWEYVLLTGTDLPDQSPKNPKFRLAIDTWKKLPLAVANRLGPAIVRNIP
jgi:FemAB-related protein (PEP-CTERM system-associated)